MRKIEPILLKKLSPFEYQKEFERIDFEIDKIDEIDFEIIINTDIPFRCEFVRRWGRPFTDYLNSSISSKKCEYKRYLQDIYMFPYLMFQKN